MIPILAVQSVERKMELKTSAMLGNYEFYYAAGRLAALTKVEADGSESPQKLSDAVNAALEQFVPPDEETAYLVKIIRKCKIQEAFDEQMPYLFAWGRTGQEPEKRPS